MINQAVSFMHTTMVSKRQLPTMRQLQNCFPCRRTAGAPEFKAETRSNCAQCTYAITARHQPATFGIICATVDTMFKANA